jgi:hypothetical protein
MAKKEEEHTSKHFFAASLNLLIFETDARFVDTTSLRALSNSYRP